MARSRHGEFIMTRRPTRSSSKPFAQQQPVFSKPSPTISATIHGQGGSRPGNTRKKEHAESTLADWRETHRAELTALRDQQGPLCGRFPREALMVGERANNESAALSARQATAYQAADQG